MVLKMNERLTPWISLPQSKEHQFSVTTIKMTILSLILCHQRKMNFLKFLWF